MVLQTATLVTHVFWRSVQPGIPPLHHSISNSETVRVRKRCRDVTTRVFSYTLEASVVVQLTQTQHTIPNITPQLGKRLILARCSTPYSLRIELPQENISTPTPHDHVGQCVRPEGGHQPAGLRPVDGTVRGAVPPVARPAGTVLGRCGQAVSLGNAGHGCHAHLHVQLRSEPGTHLHQVAGWRDDEH